MGDPDDIANNVGWGVSYSGFRLNYQTAAGSGLELVGGEVGQFNVETPETLTMLSDLPASGQNGHAFNGYVCGPGVVPEPMSIMLGCLGLTGIAGLRRLDVNGDVERKLVHGA